MTYAKRCFLSSLLRCGPSGAAGRHLASWPLRAGCDAGYSGAVAHGSNRRRRATLPELQLRATVRGSCGPRVGSIGRRPDPRVSGPLDRHAMRGVDTVIHLAATTATSPEEREGSTGSPPTPAPVRSGRAHPLRVLLCDGSHRFQRTLSSARRRLQSTPEESPCGRPSSRPRSLTAGRPLSHPLQRLSLLRGAVSGSGARYQPIWRATWPAACRLGERRQDQGWAIRARRARGALLRRIVGRVLEVTAGTGRWSRPDSAGPDRPARTRAARGPVGFATWMRPSSGGAETTGVARRTPRARGNRGDGHGARIRASGPASHHHAAPRRAAPGRRRETSRRPARPVRRVLGRCPESRW